MFLNCSDLAGAQPPSYGPGGGPSQYGRPMVAHPPVMGGGSGGVSGFDGYPGFSGGAGRGFFGGTAHGGVGDRRDDIRGRGGGGFDFGRGGGGRGSVDAGRGGFRGGRGGGRGGFDGGRSGRDGFGGRDGRHGRPRDDLDNLSLPKQEFGNLVPFEKNFYVESPSVRAMTEQEATLYRTRREITVQGHDVPKPIRMFQEANFPGI